MKSFNAAAIKTLVCAALAVSATPAFATEFKAPIAAWADSAQDCARSVITFMNEKNGANVTLLRRATGPSAVRVQPFIYKVHDGKLNLIGLDPAGKLTHRRHSFSFISENEVQIGGKRKVRCEKGSANLTQEEKALISSEFKRKSALLAAEVNAFGKK